MNILFALWVIHTVKNTDRGVKLLLEAAGREPYSFCPRKKISPRKNILQYLEPGPHWREPSAIITASSLLPIMKKRESAAESGERS